MKKIITQIIGAVLAITVGLAAQNAYGQCANNNALWTSAGNINPGQTVTINGTWGGEYNTFNCVNGSTYVIRTCNGGTWDSQLTLYNNTGGASLAYNDDFCGLQSQITWTANFTGTVRVLLDAYPCTNNSSSMTMTITRNSGGGGGNCWDGTISGTGSASSTTCLAGNESSLRASADRIYRIQITSAGCYNFSLCGSASWDSYLYLTTACPGSGGTAGGGSVIAQSDDACGLLSQISNVSLTTGTYYLTVEGFGSTDCGNFSLNVTSGAAPVAGSITAPVAFGCGSTATFSVPFQSGVNYNWSTTNGTVVSGQGTNSISIAWGSGTGSVSVVPSSACGTGAVVSTSVACSPPPANDQCANATVFSGSSQAFSTNFATGTDISSCTFNDFNDIWYSWTAPTCGQVTFATCGSTFDTHLSLWNSCGSGEIVCNDDACGLQSSISANVTAGQTYYLRVAGYNGASGTGTISMTMGAPIGVTLSSSVPNATLCFSNGSAATILSAVITGDGTVNYQWQYQDNNGNWVNISSLTASGSGTSPLTVTQNASPTSTRNYRVVVSQGTCTSTAVQLVTVIPDPILSLISSNVICFGENNGSAGASLSGGTAGNLYDLNWTPGTPIGDGTLNLSNLAPGTYTLTANGSYGCNASGSVTILEPAALVSTSTSGSIACNGGTTTVSVSASGGTAPYSGEGNYTVGAGTYSYTITDANGCTSTTSITVSEPAVLTSASTSGAIACNGGTTTVTVSANGGTAPYSGIGDYTVVAGAYSYTVTDANGCTSTTTITVSEPELLSVQLSSSDFNGFGVSCFGSNNGIITANVSGGTSSYSYNWNNGGTNATIFGLTAGNYNVDVTDNNGCTAAASTQLFEPTKVVITAENTPIACNGDLSTVTVNSSGGVMPYSVNDAGIYNLNAGIYTYNVTDDNGCNASVTIDITEPTLLTVNAGGDETVFVGYGPLSCATLDADINGGTQAYSATWSSNQSGGGIGTSILACPTSNEVYTISVVDANGCTASDEISICVVDVTCEAGNSGNMKVEMCQIPPGNPGNAHTICIDASAVPAHLAIGCVLGACGELENACAFSSSKETYLKSINVNNTLEAAIGVYPNPVDNTTTISITPKTSGEYSVTMFDMMGKVVMNIYTGSFGEYENLTFDVNMTSLMNGIYIVAINKGDELIENVRVVKQ